MYNYNISQLNLGLGVRGMEKVLKWVLEHEEDESLLGICRLLGININGFRRIELIEGKINVPKNLLIKKLLIKKYDKKIIEYLKENLKYEEKVIDVSENKIESCIKNGVSIRSILKRLLIDKSEESIVLASTIIEEYGMDGLNEETMELKDKNSFDLLNKKLLQLQIKIDELKKENKKIRIQNQEIKQLNKKVNNLVSENDKLVKQIGDNEREKEAIVINLSEKLKREKEKNEQYKLKYRELETRYSDSLNMIKELEKKAEDNKQRKKYNVAVFGNISNRKKIDSELFEMSFLKINDIENEEDILNNKKEVWILKYNLNIREQKFIRNMAKTKKIREFMSWKSLEEYIKIEGGKYRC